MKKLLGHEQLEEARSCASPVENITNCNRSHDFGVKIYVIRIRSTVRVTGKTALAGIGVFLGRRISALI
jgi:hypothetical protein